jgi:hypothetical protein
MLIRLIILELKTVIEKYSGKNEDSIEKYQ